MFAGYDQQIHLVADDLPREPAALEAWLAGVPTPEK
jgi:hypothetical protein